MIEIKDISGKTLMTVPVSSGAISHEELMKSDYIQLEWNSPVGDIIPAGTFIEYDGEKYSLLEPYQPACTSEAEYQYTPQFQSRIMAWDKHPVPLYTYDEEGSVVGREFDWEFTGSPADVLYMVKQAIMHETGEEWTYQLSDSLPATVSLQSQSSSIFSILSELADDCETEWWVDKKNNILHLSKCEHGEQVILTAGQNVKMPSITNSKDGYYTRFYVFGSTKNITQDYQSGQATNHIVNKRLTLDPLKYPGGYKDIKGHFDNGVFVSDLLPGEVFPKSLYFDSVFPSSKLTISNVRARAKYRFDSNGNKIQIGGTEDEPVYEQYAIWYFRVEGLDFDPQTIIEGKNLSVSFESGQLAGRDFELTYHEKDQTVKDAADVTAFEVKAGDFEIIIDESTGSIIPGAVYIIPQDEDKIVLYNIEMPDEYTTSAQVELEAEIDKEIARRIADNNTYEFDSNPVDFYNQGTDVELGQAVRFSFGSGTLETRVLMVEKRLDGIYQQRIRIGNEQIKGVTQELKEDVANANQNIDIIKAFNELSSSLSNAYANAQREMIEGFAAIRNMWRFDPENPNTIYSSYNVYSLGEVAAGGPGSASGGGIGGLDEELLWAILGNTGAEQISKTHLTNALSGYATEDWITAKGYITSTELKGYATLTDIDSRIDDLINGAPEAYDTLKEIADVLQGNVDSIGDIITALGAKADKTITISAGTGLSGGGDLTANRTLSLATVGTAGTYTKVTVDEYGRVTGHSALVESDIPTLSIAKITGLQSSLDSKLNASVFNDLFEKVLVDGEYAIKAKYNFYSVGEVSAGGLGEGSGSSTGGIDEAQLWSILGNTGTEQISKNHLTSALAGYLTTVSLSTITDLHSNWDALLKVAPTSYVTRWPTFAEVTSKPKTLSGYGITASSILDELKTVDGSESGLDADTLDDIQGYQFFQQGGPASTTDWSSYMYNRAYSADGTIPSDGPSGVYGYGTLLVFDSGGSSSYGGAITQIYFSHSADYAPRYRTTYGRNTSRFHDWKILARVTDNVASASKLTTTTAGSATRPVYFANGVPVSGTYTFGNSSNNAAISNGTVCTNLNADLLDGVHNGYLTANKLYLAGSVSDFDTLSGNGLYTWGTDAINRPTPYGTVLQFSNINLPIPGTNQHWVNQLAWGTEGVIYVRQSINTGNWTSWNALAYTTSNVASATKLQTARTIWGQNFDGTNNVSGVLSYVTEIKANAGAHMYIDSANGYNIGIRYNGLDSNGITITQTELRRLSNATSYNLGSSTYRWAGVYSVLGNFSGAVTIENTLSVSGLITATSGLTTQQYIQIGSGRIYWDSTNKALYVKGSDGSSINFYSLGEITAGGVGSSSSSGGLDENQLWDILGDSGTEQISKTHLTNALSSYLTTVSLSTITDLHSSWSTFLNYAKPTTLSGYGITDTYSKSDSDGRYVSKSGDTITGELTINYNTYPQLIINNGNGGYSNIKFESSGLNKVLVGYSATVGAILQNYEDSSNYINLRNGNLLWNNNYKFWHAGNDGSGSGLDADTLDGVHYTDIINGNIYSATKLQTKRTIWGKNFDGTSNISGDISINGNIEDVTEIRNGSNTYFRIASGSAVLSSVGSGNLVLRVGGTTGTSMIFMKQSNKYVGIGTESPSYKLHVNGSMYATSYANSSDLRLKNKISDIHLSTNTISNAPTFIFNWKSDGRIDIGSSAQYWHTVLPSIVKEDDNGYLTMPTANIALVSVISLARSIETIEQRVARLEQENAELKQQLKRFAA